MIFLRAKELRLGDVVRLSPLPFPDACVVKVTDDMVTFQRPYGVTSDFSYGGDGKESRVIFYTGIETFSVFRLTASTAATYTVLSRKQVT